MMLFSIIVIIFSAIIHEYMHGWMADRLGDMTAKNAGRLTLNPIPHIDPWGTIMLPLLLYLMQIGSQSPIIFGYAKPVPFNPYNLRDQKYGSAKVAIAGPASNFAVALFFGLILRFYPLTNEYIASLFFVVVYINLLLAIFNLVPIPPLDGSKVLMPFLPYNWQIRYASLERYGMLILLFFIMFGFSLITPIILFLFNLIVGGF